MSSTPQQRLTSDEEISLGQSSQISGNSIEASPLTQAPAGFDIISIVKPTTSAEVEAVVSAVPFEDPACAVPNQISLGHDGDVNVAITTEQELQQAEELSASASIQKSAIQSHAAAVSEEQVMLNTQQVINTQLGNQHAINVEVAANNSPEVGAKHTRLKNTTQVVGTSAQPVPLVKGGSDRQAKSKNFLQNPKGTILDRLVGFAAHLLKKLEKKLANFVRRESKQQSLMQQAQEIEKLKVERHSSHLQKRRKKKGYNSLRAMEDTERDPLP